MQLSREHQAQLDELLQQLRAAAAQELGYPTAFDLDYSVLADFLTVNLNNCGSVCGRAVDLTEAEKALMLRLHNEKRQIVRGEMSEHIMMVP